jgi:hypothetical protein
VKGNVSTTPTRYTVAINMATKRDHVDDEPEPARSGLTPRQFGQGGLVPRQRQVSGDPADHAFICEGEALFNEEGVDPITCDGGPVGPDWYFESKKYDAGDSTRLKKFKMLILHYLVQGGSITVDTVIGLNNIGQTLTGNFPPRCSPGTRSARTVSTWDALKAQFATWNDVIQGVFVPKRVKFQKGSQHLSFRLYQSSSAITRLRIGPFSIAYKLKRPGRV